MTRPAAPPPLPGFPTADDDVWWEPEPSLSIGTASTVSAVPPRGWTPPVREFPPGFAGAAPGPSHPDPEPRPAPKRKPPAAKRAPAPPPDPKATPPR